MISDKRLEEISTVGKMWCGTPEAPEMAAELLAARAKLAQFQWREITPDDLPQFGHEVIGAASVIPNPWYPNIIVVNDWHERNILSYEGWIARGYRFFRPLAIPSQAIPEIAHSCCTIRKELL